MHFHAAVWWGWPHATRLYTQPLLRKGQKTFHAFTSHIWQKTLRAEDITQVSFHKRSIMSTSVLKLRVQMLDPWKNESCAQASPETFEWKQTVLPNRKMQVDFDLVVCSNVQWERRVQMKPLGRGWVNLSSCCLRGRFVIPTLSVHVCVCLAPTTLTIPCHIQKQRGLYLSNEVRVAVLCYNILNCAAGVYIWSWLECCFDQSASRTEAAFYKQKY